MSGKGKHEPAERIRTLGFDPEKLGDELYGQLDIRDRWYLFYRFPKCFVGSETIRWMTHHYGISREAARTIGNALIDMSVFHHVLDDWDFREEFLFYRFYRDEKDRVGAPYSRVEALEWLTKLGVGSLDALVAQMYQAVAIQDRRVGLRLHRRSFIGKDAVCWLRRNYNLDRMRALVLGNALISLRVFHHVLDSVNFEDSDLLYRFYDDEYRDEVLTPQQNYRKAQHTILSYGIGDLDRFIAQSRRTPSLGLHDRIYGRTQYPDCFSGFDAVSLWADLLQITRPEAVTLGNYLLDLGRLYHVSGQWGFRDAYLFYRFTTPEQVALVAQPEAESR